MSEITCTPRTEKARSENSRVEGLRDPDVETFVEAARGRIRADAETVGTDVRSLEIQVRLHLPRLSRQALVGWSPDKVYEEVRLQAVVRAAEVRQWAQEAAYQAHASVLLNVEKVRRDLSLSFTDGYRTGLRFAEVRPSAGHVVQSRLHYLRSERADTVLQFGLFLPGATMPLTYVAFSRCDRQYVLDALAGHGLKAGPRETMVLTRMHGIAGIPANLMSLTVSRAVREIRARNAAEYVVTAYNPMLGFDGAAFLASGFTPIALSPVAYRYDEKGLFQTRRISGDSIPQSLDTPDNVLMVLGVTGAAKRRAAALGGLITVPRRDHSGGDHIASPATDLASPEWRTRLLGYRRTLETGWSDATAHPRYQAAPDSGGDSRGQCGVTSVWLARKLRSDLLAEPVYCQGRLRFDGDHAEGVSHHCWVEVGRDHDPRRLVLDLTGDQSAGATEPIIVGEHGDLAARGIRYEPAMRLGLDELPRDRVWPRFLALEDRLDAVR
ncbi:hypothetical protein [Microbispora corallina]|uniref:hypothetical protein n=1 Tax=Microbispora corallina TaxID=83302 RepID=UPI0019503873|nr:hypothetical protein [Microbispora corallina]